MAHIHPTAFVDPSAELGRDVVVGPFSYVGADVVIEDGTRLHDHVSVSGPTTIGRDNEIHPFAVVGAAPQDLKHRGEPTRCEVGDRNQIREHVTIHRGTVVGGGLTRVGDDNLFMVAAHVAHDCVVGSHCVVANQVMLAGHVHVEDGVNIGGGAGVHHYVTIGTLAFVGGLTRVKKDVPPYMKVDGDPCEVRGVNSIALIRRQVDEADLLELREAYKRLFRPPGSNGRGAIAPLGRGRALPVVEVPGPAVAAGTTSAVRARPIESVLPETLERPTNGHAPAVHTMEGRIAHVLALHGSCPLVARLCAALRRSAAGIHGRARETQREDSKFATEPK